MNYMRASNGASPLKRRQNQHNGGYFVKIAFEIGRPAFLNRNIDDRQLATWAEARAAIYTAKKPYVLEIIQALLADAEKAADSFASFSTKSHREIARARSSRNAPAFNSACPYCSDLIDKSSAHLDHIHPVQRGGPSEEWNLVYVCIKCNQAKRDLSLMEFADTDYARSKHIQLRTLLRNLKGLQKSVDIV